MEPSDPDDWFDYSGLEERPPSPTEPDAAAARTDDDWLDEERVESRRRTSPLEWIDRRVLVVAGSVIAVLIAGLAAGGVFSGGGSTSSNPPTTTAPTTTRQATTAATTVQSLPAPTAPLKPGDAGAQVTLLQRDLARLGFSAGKADGQYGPATTEAVKKFQQSAGLTADGICGPATLAALKTALRGA